jgi:hypothetical protein
VTVVVHAIELHAFQVAHLFGGVAPEAMYLLRFWSAARGAQAQDVKRQIELADLPEALWLRLWLLYPGTQGSGLNLCTGGPASAPADAQAAIVASFKQHKHATEFVHVALKLVANTFETGSLRALYCTSTSVEGMTARAAGASPTPVGVFVSQRTHPNLRVALCFAGDSGQESRDFFAALHLNDCIESMHINFSNVPACCEALIVDGFCNFMQQGAISAAACAGAANRKQVGELVMRRGQVLHPDPEDSPMQRTLRSCCTPCSCTVGRLLLPELRCRNNACAVWVADALCAIAPLPELEYDFIAAILQPAGPELTRCAAFEQRLRETLGAGPWLVHRQGGSLSLPAGNLHGL